MTDTWQIEIVQATNGYSVRHSKSDGGTFAIMHTTVATNEDELGQVVKDIVRGNLPPSNRCSLATSR